MNREELSNKLIAVANDLIHAKGYISHIDVFMKLNYLDSKDYNAWRMKQIPYLERVINVNLGTISFMMKFIRKHAKDKGLKKVGQTTYLGVKAKNLSSDFPSREKQLLKKHMQLI